MATDPRLSVNIHAVVIWLELLDYELGHWCNDCMLSTGIRFWIVWFTSTPTDGFIKLVEQYRCHECQGTNVVADADHT